jgi:hypothetical protein
MIEWEYKFYSQALITKIPLTKRGGLENYEKNLQEGEDAVNKITKKGWDLFSSHVTSFNMLVFIFRRKKIK